MSEHGQPTCDHCGSRLLKPGYRLCAQCDPESLRNRRAEAEIRELRDYEREQLYDGNRRRKFIPQ